jgi:hypothetical protein
MEAYAHARAERPDIHLLTRARLSAEMRTLSRLMSAVTAGDRLQVERLASALRRLDERVHAEEEAANDYRRAGSGPAKSSPVLVPPVIDDGEDDEEDDVEVMFGKTADVEDVEDAQDVEDVEDVEDAEDAEDVSDAEDIDAAQAVEDGDAEPTDEPGADDPEPNRGDVTAEIDVSSLRHPASVEQVEAIEGDDPGPEFEPGYTPRG